MINFRGKKVSDPPINETEFCDLIDVVVKEPESGRWKKRLGHRETFDAAIGLQKVQIRLLERKLKQMGMEEKPLKIYP